jgi:hypothetical protein
MITPEPEPWPPPLGLLAHETALAGRQKLAQERIHLHLAPVDGRSRVLGHDVHHGRVTAAAAATKFKPSGTA